MAETTKKEDTVQDEEIVVSERVTKKDILSAYNKGLNYYQIAVKYFKADDDVTVGKVRSVVEAEIKEV